MTIHESRALDPRRSQYFQSFDAEFVDGRQMLCGDLCPVALSEGEGEYSDLEYVTKICQRAIDENKDWSVELGSILKANARATRYLEYFITFLGRDTKDSSIKTYQLALMMDLITDKPEGELEVLLFREKPSEGASAASGGK